MPITNFEPHQLKIVEKLDRKFKVIMTQWEATPAVIDTPVKLAHLTTFFSRILQVYNVLLNKYVTNDDYLAFRIENILAYMLGGDML
jgi:hypothetical protein